MSEGFPTAVPEQHEAEISDSACVETMRDGNFEMAGKWYAQQERLVDADPSPHGRLQLTVRFAHLQFESRAIDPDTGEWYALGTQEAACTDADQRVGVAEEKVRIARTLGDDSLAVAETELRQSKRTLAQVGEILADMRAAWAHEHPPGR